jgi:hypothetical protein
MSFDRAIETIEAIIKRQRESGEQLADPAQQTYLETVQDAVSQIVACIKEAHRLSKVPGRLSSLSGLNHLRANSANLTRLGKAFGQTENLVIQDSKTAEIGSALIVFFTEFLRTHPRWTATVHKETQEKIQTLKTNLERFNKEAYRQQLTTVIDENPLDAVDLEHVIRVDANSEWQVVPSVTTLNSDELSSYQTTMEEIRSEANKLRESLHKVQTLQRTLLAVPFPAGTDSKPEVFEAIREEKLSSLKEKIDIQTRQLNLLEAAFRAIQNAYFQLANQEGQISPAARKEERNALENKIVEAIGKLRESDIAFLTKAGKLEIDTSCRLEDLEQRINASKQEGDAIDSEITEARGQHAAKIARLNLFISRLKGEHGDPVLSMNCESLIKELGYDLAKDLHDIWVVRMDYTCVTAEISDKGWFGSPKTSSAREKFYTLINARVNGLNRQHETQMSADTQKSEGIHSRTKALIELAHQKLQVQLDALKYHHHQINQKRTEIDFALTDVRAEIESLKAFQTECSGTNAAERFVEYQDVHDKLQAWLEKHGQEITALQWQIAEQNRRQEKANSALDMAALAPLPAAFTGKQQQMAALTQSQNDAMASLRTTYTEIDSLCQWFTKPKLVKILDELNTLNAQETEDPKEKKRLLVSIKNALDDLTHQKTWLAQMPAHHHENYQLAQAIFGVEAQLCEKQANLLLAQHNSLATVKTRFFDDIFPRYLQQRAVKYYWLDAFSKLLGFVLGVFGYKTEAKARTEYLAELQTKWTTFEHKEDHPTAELTSFIDQGLKFSPRKLNDPNSLRAHLCLFKSAVEEVSTNLSSETPSHSHQIH